MDRLSPLDDVFVVLERDELPMHIGSLLVFAGPPPEYDEVLQSMAGRLDSLPRYRQRLRQVPFQLGRPGWEDDPHFHLPYHLRHTALPHPGGTAQLQALAGRLLSHRLDLSRPLWEMWLIEGLQDGGFAVINKVHHSMVDGLSGTDIMRLILDDTAEPPAPQPSPWRPEPPEGALRFTAGAIATGVAGQVRRFGNLIADLADPRDAARGLAAAVMGTWRLGRDLVHIDEHLLGTPGPHRRWAWARGDLDRIKAIKTAHGTTVNDVLLSAIAGGLRAFLLHRGAHLDRQSAVRTLVPVSTRVPGRDFGGNEVAAYLADLLVGIADPVQRLQAMHEQMSELKSSGMLQGTDALVANAVFLPPPLFAAAGRLAARAPQPMVATITTNVPGPQHELYMLGRPMQQMYPYVPLGMNQLVTVAIISYNGQINCGITADYGAVPDVDILAAGIESSLAALDDRTPAGH
jgi:WS/DGAT/MGAT family acyltransferase